MASAGLPSFLRESDKVPPSSSSSSSSSSFDSLDPLPCGGRDGSRSFELAVSLEALLQIEDAAELLFSVLWDCPEPDGDHHGEYRNVIWLSDDIFIVDSYASLSSISRFSIELDDDQLAPYISVFQMPTADDDDPTLSSILSPAPSLLDVGRVLDTLLQLLAKHKAIQDIHIHRLRFDWFNPFEPFRASLEALKSFVSEAASPRSICFDDAELTDDQWRVVAFNCHENVTLRLRKSFKELTCRGPLEALIGAMKCNMCPKNLCFRSIDDIPTDIFQDFVDTLGSTTSLKGFEITALSDNIPALISLCAGIARNHGLVKLKLKDCVHPSTGSMTLSDTEWEFVCRSLASHPTLRSLHTSVRIATPSLSKERDQVMIRYISSNPVLCTFTSFGRCFHNYDNVLQAVRPVLALNRFRPVVTTIKQQTDETVCRKLFTSALLNDDVLKRPAWRFWLLKENADILPQMISRSDKNVPLLEPLPL